MKAAFAHTQTYSRKGNGKSRSIADICDEAARRDGAVPHVANPQAPRIIEGMNPSDIPAIIEERAQAQNRFLRQRRKELPDRAGELRGIRADTHVLVASVYSYPTPVAEYDTEQYERWLTDVVQFAKRDAAATGLEIMTIVEHLDETYPHVHVHAVPEITATNPRLNARRCHVGHIAQDDHIARNKSGSPSRSYKQAMSAWQDQYHREVGERHGQARTGPKRRRLDRATWKADKDRLEILRQRAVEEHAVSDAKVQFEEQAREMAQTLARQARDLRKKEEFVDADRMAAQSARLVAEREADCIVQAARDREPGIAAAAEREVASRLATSRRELETLSKDLSVERQRLRVEKDTFEQSRQSAIQDATRTAVQVIAAVFTGEAGIGKDGNFFIATDDLRKRVIDMRISPILADVVRAVGDLWHGLKDRLSVEKRAEEEVRARAWAKRASDAVPPSTGGPSR